MPAQPAFIRIDGEIRTSYGWDGKARRAGGTLFPRAELVSVGRSKAAEAWLASPGTAKALNALNAEIVDEYGGDHRVTGVKRSAAVAAVERAKYDRWISAGRPEPGSARFNRDTMRTVYVAKPNQTNHMWGGAYDLDIDALHLPPHKPGSDEGLAAFWTLAERHGFTPIITDPDASRAEAWHFDHLGPLKPIREAMLARPSEVARSLVYPLVAEVGCILMGTHTGDKQMQRLVQARAMLAGAWVGVPDGIIGPKTIAGLRGLGLDRAKVGDDPGMLISMLDAAEIGTRELALL